MSPLHISNTHDFTQAKLPHPSPSTSACHITVVHLLNYHILLYYHKIKTTATRYNHHNTLPRPPPSETLPYTITITVRFHYYHTQPDTNSLNHNRTTSQNADLLSHNTLQELQTMLSYSVTTCWSSIKKKRCCTLFSKELYNSVCLVNMLSLCLVLSLCSPRNVNYYKSLTVSSIPINMDIKRFL